MAIAAGRDLKAVFLQPNQIITSMNELVDKINAEIETFKKESQSHLDGVKAAGARARKSTLELTRLFKDYRKDSIEASKK